MGALPIPDETSATTVALAQKSTAELQTVAEVWHGPMAAANLNITNLFGIMGDHANNARSGKKRGLEGAKAAELAEVMGPEWDGLTPEAKALTIADFGCHGHKVDNACKATVPASVAIWAESTGSKPISMPSLADLQNEEAAALKAGAAKVTSLSTMLFCKTAQSRHGANTHAVGFQSWQMQHLEGIPFEWDDESKARFLENQAAILVTLAAKDIIIAYVNELKAHSQKIDSILQNVYNGLHDMPTLLELAAGGLIYFQTDFAGLSVKSLVCTAFEMEPI
ncbi:hypothetical protein WJX74_005752 [Apatococcus lobatus]|uniref:Uncharacterized protein n=1 Tax=Apatococcus lobatus TaxID=904363 RepID=A0AAW1SGG7_9CHLO